MREKVGKGKERNKLLNFNDTKAIYVHIRYLRNETIFDTSTYHPN